MQEKVSCVNQVLSLQENELGAKEGSPRWKWEGQEETCLQSCIQVSLKGHPVKPHPCGRAPEQLWPQTQPCSNHSEAQSWHGTCSKSLCDLTYSFMWFFIRNSLNLLSLSEFPFYPKGEHIEIPPGIPASMRWLCTINISLESFT